jgi:hypothetical protein
MHFAAAIEKRFEGNIKVELKRITIELLSKKSN